jgi:hypothetical protein
VGELTHQRAVQLASAEVEIFETGLARREREEGLMPEARHDHDGVEWVITTAWRAHLRQI